MVRVVSEQSELRALRGAAGWWESASKMPFSFDRAAINRRADGRLSLAVCFRIQPTSKHEVHLSLLYCSSRLGRFRAMTTQIVSHGTSGGPRPDTKLQYIWLFLFGSNITYCLSSPLIVKGEVLVREAKEIVLPSLKLIMFLNVCAHNLDFKMGALNYLNTAIFAGFQIS